jgi:Tfp pilus assembly protein PilE
MKNQKGITLVVLIITIILMLILTTVTVTTSINGGLINSTQSAKENARALEVERAEEMWEISVRDDREDGKTEKTLEELLEELREKELLTEKEVEEIRKNKSITIGNRTISFEINYTSAQEDSEREYIESIKIGDYVDYNPTQRVSEKNKSKLTYVSPVGTASSHGNGYEEQTFEARTDIKWRVYDINKETGVITLISEEVIGPKRGGTLQSNFILYAGIGYLYSEQEIESACAIYGYGYGADTSKSTAYTVGGPFDDKITGAIEGTGARSMDLTDIISSNPTFLLGTIGSIYYPTMSGDSLGRSTEKTDKNLEYSSTQKYDVNELEVGKAKFNLIFKAKDEETNLAYWLKTRTVRRIISSDAANNSMGFCNWVVINGNRVNNKRICGSTTIKFGSTPATELGIRPIVVLKKGIGLTKDTSKSENKEYATWNLE